jgi:trk system potassium uptake protein TrkA
MDRYAIIGLGRFGYRLACMLTQAGAEVIAVDRHRTIVEDIRDSVTLAVCMDCTDEKALLAQGVDKVDVAVVGIGGEFEASVLTTVILKQLGVPRVVSRATSPTRGEILRRVGADAIVNPEDESAYRWSHRLLGPNVMEQIPLAEGHSLVQIPTPAEWRGKSLAELDVRRNCNVNVVAIRRESVDTDLDQPPRPTIEVPMPHRKLDVGDILVLIGADEAISALPG